MLKIIISAALFAYGMYTIQRPKFFLNPLTKFWKKFPKGIHEPLFSCGVCVASIWGGLFMLYNYIVFTYCNEKLYYLLMVPLCVVASGGITAILDRFIKACEYHYRYNPIIPNANYSYLSDFGIRDSFIMNLILDIQDKTKIIEIGGYTDKFSKYFGDRYFSFDKAQGRDILNIRVGGNYFVIIKGLAFEGDINQLLMILDNCDGFIIDCSLAGESMRQLNQITDRYTKIAQIPYKLDSTAISPEHCGGDINNRVLLVKKI